MQNLLVTGGCGFIGSNFIRYLLKESSLPQDGSSSFSDSISFSDGISFSDDSSFSEKNYSLFTGRIINVDKLTYAGNPESLEDIEKEFKERYIFEKADICNIKELERIFKTYEIDSVCHFAAESHVDRSIASPESFIDTNIKGTFNLLECSLKQYSNTKENTQNSKSRFTLFHHVSTDEVYGSLGETGYFTETTPYSPNSPYSASKAASDHLVRAWHKTYGLPVTISNCSNNYGPFQFPEKLIPLMILNAVEGKELPIYGDGKNIRDWLYVKDHCAAIWLIMQKGKRGDTYNIGGGCELENREVVERICFIIDKFRDSFFKNNENCSNTNKLSSSKELIRFIKDRPGHDFRYAVDSTKIKEELGWKPLESFETGIEKTVKWYLNNLKWVERVKSGEYLDWIKTHY